MLAIGALRVDTTFAQQGSTDFDLWSAVPQALRDGLTDDEADELVDGYLQLLTDQYARQHSFPETLVALLADEPEVRNVFISALDDRDDIAAAGRIFDELNAADPERLKRYVHLATALAVVHDQPERLSRQTSWGVRDVEASQFPAPPDPADVYAYYTRSARNRRFVFQPVNLPWAMLVHVVDNQTSAEDRLWAQQRYRNNLIIPALYRSVPYDNDKRNREPANLGDRDYSLPNLLEYGGVCVEQAYFASRVAKTFCVPAMTVSGESRFGGGHAWVGNLVTHGGQASLAFSGRYLFDHYYTGMVRDPQTGRTALERNVAMMFDGMSVSYESYLRSSVLLRIAASMRGGQPDASLALTEYALRNNPYLPAGWRLLMQHVSNETLSTDDALAWFNDMLDVLADHPDMTFECLQTFIDCYAADDLDNRERMYRQALAIYDERPDLQFRLCSILAEEMVAAEKPREALMFLLRAVIRHAHEGSVVIPATAQVVGYARELGAEEATYTELLKALDDFPRRRRNATEDSPAYTSFKETIERLRPTRN